jgi:hypothetical protein
MRPVAAALFFLTACITFDHDNDDHVIGARTDMRTQPGDYAGYRVVTACSGTWSDVGVIGTGTIEPADIAGAGQELHTRLTDFASIWGWGGTSLVCEPGVGTSIDLNNWRDVDLLIVRIGDWLRERDYKLQVGIAVGGQPVPLATE